ncbi:MAG: recombination protein O N-terminal domain-containing protein, partial [Eubacteriales bacterium]|nr:recombination protein O N-terminal domain-containing protein [Eubacteriales bacterium]
MRERIVVRGIVIREVQYGESDKILNILTREYGLITVSAK